MKTLLYSLCFLTLLSTTSCNKNKITYDAYFYTNKDDPYERISLFINDKNYGELPYLSEKPDFGNDSLIRKTIHVPLKIDRYPLAARNPYGYIKTDGTLTIKKRSQSVVTTIGVMSIKTEGTKLLVEMGYN